MRYLIAILALAGVIVSALALQVHYSTGTEPCSINARWDCGVVNHSPFARLATFQWRSSALWATWCWLAWRCCGSGSFWFWPRSADSAFALRLTFIEQYVLAGVVPLLRHLPEPHRADCAAEPGLAGSGALAAQAQRPSHLNAGLDCADQLSLPAPLLSPAR